MAYEHMNHTYRSMLRWKEWKHTALRTVEVKVLLGRLRDITEQFEEPTSIKVQCFLLLHFFPYIFIFAL